MFQSPFRPVIWFTVGRAKRGTSSFLLLPHHLLENRKLRTSGEIKGRPPKSVHCAPHFCSHSLSPPFSIYLGHLFHLFSLSLGPDPGLRGGKSGQVEGWPGIDTLVQWHVYEHTSHLLRFRFPESGKPFVFQPTAEKPAPPFPPPTPNDRLAVDLALTGNRTKMGGLWRV